MASLNLGKLNVGGTTSVSYGDQSPAVDAVPLTWQVGDRRFYVGADPNIIAYQCTVAGTPGTWVALPEGKRLVSVQVFIAGSGATYTPAADITMLIVEGLAAGGGGSGSAGSSAGQYSVGYPGGEGGRFVKVYNAPGACTYNVGAAGTQGANTGAAAGNGGDTTFTDGTTLCTAKGGTGGRAAVATGTATIFNSGGDGGAVATNGDQNYGGACGSMSIRASAQATAGQGGGENGGDSRSTSGAGNAAKGVRGGGGGGVALNGAGAVVGGVGGTGQITIWAYAG